MPDLWEHFRKNVEWGRELQGTACVCVCVCEGCKTVVKCVMSWLSEETQWADVLLGFYCCEETP